MKLTRLAALCLICLTSPQSLAADIVELRVAGSVSATGNIQAKREQPFFEALAERTGLPLAVSYRPIDHLDMDPEEGLELVQHGIVDIVSLGVAVISRRDPFFLGLDVVGLTPDYDNARRVVSAFSGPIEAHLRDIYNAKLLGIWPFGPQVLFCKPMIGGLDEIEGLKVRVYDANLGAFIETLGAIPVEIKFADVRQALDLKIVDCAITGPSSANTAGWVYETEVMMPLGFQIAFNAYAINLDRWNTFTPDEQDAIAAAFDVYIDDVWQYSEELFADALRCNVGDTPCSTVPSADLKLVPIEPADQDLLRNSLATISLPAWAASCERLHAGCHDLWVGTVGKALVID